MKKVAFYTLGCKLNFSETSTIARMFEKRGYKRVEFTERPDIFIINTCSVTDNADKKCRKVVKEARKISPHAYVIIIGCYAQLKPKEIAEIPGVNAVLGAAEKFQLLDLLDGFQPKSSPEIHAQEITQTREFVSGYSMNDRTRTFLKVQDGCNYNCAFCTIPLARGRSRSGSIGEVLEQARQIAQTSAKEVVLTGVNLGDFGIVNGRRQHTFHDLVVALDEVEGISRYRISSIEPNLLADRTIRFVAQSQRFVPHFHIPLQSGADSLLRSMRRRYQRSLYQDRVASIKSLMPHACIGVDVIVGLPGETEELFLETAQFLNELDISYLHVFTYSERPNTAAANYEGKVDPRTRHERSKMLRSLSEKKRRHFYENHLGSVREVLFEQEEDSGMMHGFTDNYVRIETPYDPLLINEIRPVRLEAINPNGYVQVSEVAANAALHPA